MDEGVDEAIYTPTRSPMFRQRVFLCEQNVKKQSHRSLGIKILAYTKLICQMYDFIYDI